MCLQFSNLLNVEFSDLANTARLLASVNFVLDDVSSKVLFISPKSPHNLLCGHTKSPQVLLLSVEGDYRLLWKSVSPKERTRKESSLMWLIWHRAVAVNHWRGRIDGNVDIRCPICHRGSEESVLHRFWECESSQRAWQFAIHIMNQLVKGKDVRGPWQPLSWKQGIFSYRIPRKFDAFKQIWLELRSVVLWTLWIERNDIVFNNQRWPPAKLLQQVKTGIIDYGRVEWDNLTRIKPGDSEPRSASLGPFIDRRCRFDIFDSMGLGKPWWMLSAPLEGFVFQPP
ncbi:hypothetical protein KC19_VG246300 [Ceratodon purpureus]|uniref:Reverse transcriptase zinc-binding domain-containing protein n=1 Tax=Ceratodon purpureus TaxID=3225 RepID=A0A8T0HTE9_CERPU|nr:hypothetical protein KC19_VG246300 [Ceratodon purpureus]